MSIEAMKQALEALEDARLYNYALKHKETDGLISTLRQAIEQAEKQEPVAWGVFEGNLHDMFFTQKDAKDMARLKGDHAEVKPLYTTPQPQRERVIFPTMLRKMWSGGEVQAWLDENVNKEKNT